MQSRCSLAVAALIMLAWSGWGAAGQDVTYRLQAGQPEVRGGYSQGTTENRSYRRVTYAANTIRMSTGWEAYERRNPNTGKTEEVPAFSVTFTATFDAPPAEARPGHEFDLNLSAAMSVSGDPAKLGAYDWFEVSYAVNGMGIQGDHAVKVGRIHTEAEGWHLVRSDKTTARGQFPATLAPSVERQGYASFQVYLNSIDGGSADINGCVVEWKYARTAGPLLRDFEVRGIRPSLAGPATDAVVSVETMLDQKERAAGAQVSFGPGIMVTEPPTAVPARLDASKWDLSCPIRVAPDAGLGTREVTVKLADGGQGKAAFLVRPFVVVFDIDGMRPDVLKGALNAQAGQIGGLLGRRKGEKTLGGLRFGEHEAGVWLSDTTTVFPSYTFSTQASIYTGVSPGVHHITANEYLDRCATLGSVRVYSFTGTYQANQVGDAIAVYGDRLATRVLHAPTIYNVLSDRQGVGPSVVASNMYGAGVAAENWWRSGSIDYLLYYFNRTTQAYDLEMAEKGLARLTEMLALPPEYWPSVTTFYFASLDHYSHGVDDSEESKQTRMLEQYINPLVGWILQEVLERVPTAVFVFTADHGHTDVRAGAPICFADFARALTVYSFGADAPVRLWYAVGGVNRYDFDQANLLFAPNGGSAFIYAKGAEAGEAGWRLPPPREDVLRIARWLERMNDATVTMPPTPPAFPACGKPPYFDLILLRETARDGWAGPYGVYEGGTTRDLSEYLRGHPELLQRWGWNADERDIAFLAQVLNAASCRNSGDLMVIPRYPAYYFGYSSLPGEHGSILWTDMKIPFVVAQWGARSVEGITSVLQGTIADPLRPRVTDVAPTVAAFCGQKWRGLRHPAEGGQTQPPDAPPPLAPATSGTPPTPVKSPPPPAPPAVGPPPAPAVAGAEPPPTTPPAAPPAVAPAPPPPAPRRAVVTRASAGASVRSAGGDWQPASVGTELALGSALRVGAGDLVTLGLADPGGAADQGGSLSLATGSELGVDGLGLALAVGRVDASVKRRDGAFRAVILTTPLVSVLAQAAEFALSHATTPAGETVVHVSEGEVLVVPRLGTGRAQWLRAGQEIRRTAGTSPEPPTTAGPAVPTAPQTPVAAGPAVPATPQVPVAAPPAAAPPPAPPPAPAAASTVRTLVYHQITAVTKEDAIEIYNGQESRLSASGNRVALSLCPKPGDRDRRARVAVAEADGTGLRTIDTIAASPQVDISADGQTVVAAAGGELRAATVANGGRLLLAISNTGDVRITGDGRRIVYCQANNGMLAETGQAKIYERGIYAIDAAGAGWHKVIGASEIAPVLGIAPDQVSIFYSNSRGSALDISADGGRLIFLVNCTRRGGSHVLVSDGDGKGARKVFSTDQSVGNVGISDDGSTIAWTAQVTGQPGRQGWVARFDGSEARRLTDLADMGRSLSLSADGTWAVFGAEAVLYRTDGREFLMLGPGGTSLNNQRLGGDRLTNLVMAANGRRFLSVFNDEQLATLDLDPVDLGNAPRVSDVSLTPPDVQPDPRRLMTAKARLQTPFQLVTRSTYVQILLDGRRDSTIGGGEEMRDDERGYGDEVHGDGLYTNANVHGSAKSTPGLRHVRIKAEIEADDGRHHATVVEVAPAP